MTEDQWTYVSAKLTAIELVVLAIAKASPQVAEVKSKIAEQADSQEAALLFSDLSEKHVAAIRRYVSQISDAI